MPIPKQSDSRLEEQTSGKGRVYTRRGHSHGLYDLGFVLSGSEVMDVPLFLNNMVGRGVTAVFLGIWSFFSMPCGLLYHR